MLLKRSLEKLWWMLIFRLFLTGISNIYCFLLYHVILMMGVNISFLLSDVELLYVLLKLSSGKLVILSCLCLERIDDLFTAAFLNAFVHFKFFLNLSHSLSDSLITLSQRRRLVRNNSWLLYWRNASIVSLVEVFLAKSQYRFLLCVITLPLVLL